MARTVELHEYLPPFLMDFREMRELLAAETPEFQRLCNDCDGLIDEVFILTATETGIARFEKMMKIVPAEGEPLESRRNTVMTRWYDSTPYTVKALRNRIIALQKNTNVQVQTSADGLPDYNLKIITHLEKMGQVDDLAFIIQSMIPCNMVIESQNTLDCADEVGLGYGVGMGITNTMFNTNDLNATVDLDVSGGLGIGFSMTETLFLTDDLTKKIDDSVVGYAGIGSRHTNIISIT